MSERSARNNFLLISALALVVLGLLAFWATRGPEKLSLRIPGTDRGPDNELGTNANAVLAGKLTRGEGQPAPLKGAWPQFRGPERDGISRETTPLIRSLQPAPKTLWSITVGEGYAGPAIRNGRVYLMDYDREKKQDALRCFSLQDGSEIWRFAYPVAVKRNHGMTRTVPTVADQYVVAMGPKCHVVCVDATTGELKWGKDLVQEFGTTVPPWYAGQCPLVEGDRVILAPAGPDALVMAVELKTGNVLWQSPNPNAWKMTHTSVVPMEIDGERMYVYCGHGGVAGVSAKTGAILWQTTDWKISIATVPTPIVLDGGKVFFSGGYEAGAAMMQIAKSGDTWSAKTLYRVNAKTFGATQQTPILLEGRIYGIRPDNKFACISPDDGKVLWTSAPGQNFGLGPFIIADNTILALNDGGVLRMIEAADQYKLLGETKIFDGRECWGPMAMAEGRLLIRDLTTMLCLDMARN